MTKKSEQIERTMTNGNGNGNHKSEVEERENKRLRQILQKAVNTEKAPDALRDRISKMIREK